MFAILVVAVRSGPRLDDILRNVTVPVQLTFIDVDVLSIFWILLFFCWVVSWTKVRAKTACCLEPFFSWSEKLMFLEFEIFAELMIVTVVWPRAGSFISEVDHFSQLYFERIVCLVDVSFELGLEGLWGKYCWLAFGSCLFLLPLDFINQLKLMFLVKWLFFQRLESLLFVQIPAWAFGLGFLFGLVCIDFSRIWV